jgi:hypothetical protein
MASEALSRQDRPHCIPADEPEREDVMKGGCVIVGLCAAALSIGCAGSSSPTAPTGAAPAAISLNGGLSATSVMGDPAQPSRAAALVPFKGSLNGEYGAPSGEFPIFHESIAGEGHATNLGRYALAVEETVNLLNASAVGTLVLTAANGDTVTGTFTGRAQPGPLVSITEEVTITGGTGRFAGATGSFVIDRVFDPGKRTTTGSFAGSISPTGANAH